jgi:hypothetical protein
MRKALTIFLLSASVFSRAQSKNNGGDTAAAVNVFVQKIQQAYQQAHYLGFRIGYYYANADMPNQYLDSLSGEIQMDKGRSRFELQGTETVLTDKYSIQVNNDDRTIYLAPAHRIGVANPLGMIDSIFAHIGGIRSTVLHAGDQDILKLVFPPGQPYSQLEIRIDSHTGFFQRIIYAVNTVNVVGKELINRPDNQTPYQAEGKMEIVFSGYQQGHFDDGIFKEDNFFNRIAAGRFEPSGRYKDYHIFLASSNL